jgi:hypothetical protein
VEERIKNIKGGSSNSRTAEQRPASQPETQLNQGDRLCDRGSNRKSNSPTKPNSWPQKAKNDPDDLPIEDDDPINTVDLNNESCVNSPGDSPGDRINTVNNSSENTKETPKPAAGLTLEELDRKMREAGVDMGGPLWRGKI